MPAIPIEHDNEVFLGDTYFPILPPVSVTNISVTPNPVIFGDQTRQGETQIMSQLIQGSNTGGGGIYKGNPRTDVERFWKSRAETRYRSLLTLPPLAIDMGKPAGLTSEVLVLSVEYRDFQFFMFANKVYQWLEATGVWSASERTLTTTPTDAVVFKDKLYVATGTDIHIRDNTGAWSTQANPATFLAVWDTKIWRLNTVGNIWTIYWSTDGIAWTAAGELLTDIIPHQFAVYRDALGASALYVMTETGPWVYDFANTRFLPSEVRIPKVQPDHRVLATVFRDGKMYFTSGGLGVVSVSAGNPFIAAPVGLDLDDGVPAEDNGRLVAIAADFNWLLVLLDSATTADEDDEWQANPFESWDWSVGSGPATIRAWSGGWHTIWESPTPGIPGQVLAVSSAYGKRRLYWGQGASAFYMDLPTQVHNPRQSPISKFAPGPVSHITPWFDYGSEVQDKIHGHFYVNTTGCSPSEKVTLYYGKNLDDNQWLSMGTIETNGQTIFKIGDKIGDQANFFRFRIDLERGSDQTKRPIVEFWASEFMRLLPATYGFGFELDLTKTHRGQSPAELLAAIKRLSDPAVTPNLIPFAYQDEFGPEPQTHYGRVSRLAGQEFPGLELRGQSNYMVSFMVPYKDDSE